MTLIQRRFAMTAARPLGDGEYAECFNLYKKIPLEILFPME